ncbi:M4 family metallopeptidase [Hymenobacter perfusus]|uniref:T9SS C-terminal target domain-containing protein n=1 Tax=Hymenobacter perfusus TaxID=1236770 RepID=A0A3R9NGC1_9BACT|nr:M4 family metallopeptidase [Hymenobacter perfusus]RSK46463.1 T9SS C-terminal target domain-containing protein [Hymenobacter perfusus]
MINKYSAATLLLLGGLTSTALAQDFSRVQTKDLNDNGTPYLVKFRAAGTAYKLSEARTVLKEQLELTSDDQMVQAKTEADQLGFVHEKYQQYYKGIKVEHATYSVHARQGNVESISGQFERVRGLNITPSLDAKAALERAVAFVGAKTYMWQDAQEEAGLKQQENNPAATYKPQGELVVMRNERSTRQLGKPTLAWKFNVYAKAPLSRAYIYVDAHSGEIVGQDNIIKHAGATATFATAYNGTRSFATETTTGGYRLREYTRGLGIETYNCKKGNSYTSATDFIDADNNWTAAEYNNANFDNIAGDAHFGAQATYDYWKLVHNRNSFDNAGAKIKSYVHFDDVPGGAGYENAYWNGSVMTYGDGASTFKPLTAMDVCGHEIGHAVCEKTANLTYQNESGAMNEGFSDIWGACVEARAVSTYGLTGKSTWLIGEEIMKAGGALRSMSNPNAYGQPDTYKGTNWRATTTSPTQANDYGGVHTNSGVLNFWFYLLSQGGSGTNDIGSAYSVTGSGIDAAAKIAYRTESVYLTASSTYANARTASISAATDLYGAGSAQVTAVTNAWYAVGVGAAAGGGTTPPPTTVTYCASKGTSTAYEWIDYVKLGTIARTSAADAGYYNGTATSTSIAAGSSQTISFSAGFASTAYTEYWDIYIDYNQDGDFLDAGETIVTGSSASAGTLTGTFTVPTTAKSGATRLRVVLSDASATASCNSYSYGETEDYTVNITGGAALAPAGVASLTGGSSLSNSIEKAITVFPNPAADVLNIALASKAPVVSATVTDLRGARVSNARFENGQLHVAGLAKGIYLLTVSDGQKSFHEKFVKE